MLVKRASDSSLEIVFDTSEKIQNTVADMPTNQAMNEAEKTLNTLFFFCEIKF